MQEAYTLHGLVPGPGVGLGQLPHTPPSPHHPHPSRPGPGPGPDPCKIYVYCMDTCVDINVFFPRLPYIMLCFLIFSHTIPYCLI